MEGVEATGRRGEEEKGEGEKRRGGEGENGRRGNGVWMKEAVPLLGLCCF